MFEEPENEVPLYVYVVGPLGIVVLALVVLLTVLAVSRIYHRCRLKKQMRRALLVRYLCTQYAVEPLINRHIGTSHLSFLVRLFSLWRLKCASIIEKIPQSVFF